MTQVVTEFVTRSSTDGSGPPVTAKRIGSTWQFSWSGHGGSLIGITYEQAQKVAAEIARQVADLEPLRREIERRRDDIGNWLESQQEPT